MNDLRRALALIALGLTGLLGDEAYGSSGNKHLGAVMDSKKGHPYTAIICIVIVFFFVSVSPA